MMDKTLLCMVLFALPVSVAGKTVFGDSTMFGTQLRGLSMGMSTAEFSRVKALRMFGGMAQERLNGSPFFDRAMYTFRDDTLRQVVLSKPENCEVGIVQTRELIRQANTTWGKGGRFVVVGSGRGREWRTLAGVKWVLGDNLIFKLAFPPKAVSQSGNEACMVQAVMAFENEAADFLPILEVEAEKRKKLEEEFHAE